jgi:hypothetical protein
MIGAGVGLASIPFVFWQLLVWLMGNCFFEQGCAPHEGLKLAGIFALTCGAALVLGWLVARLAQAIQRMMDEPQP